MAINTRRIGDSMNDKLVEASINSLFKQGGESVDFWMNMAPNNFNIDQKLKFAEIAQRDFQSAMYCKSIDKICEMIETLFRKYDYDHKILHSE